MGFFNQPRQETPYVPPFGRGHRAAPTLLGGALPPEADLAPLTPPATTVELRFRRVILNGHDTGFDHAYVVVTDNHTGKQHVHQASPLGPRGWLPLPMGTIKATTDDYKSGATGYHEPYKHVAGFTTDEPVESVNRQLSSFGVTFNEERIPYRLPDPGIPLLPRNKTPLVATPNSNYYGGAVWEHLTGNVPKVPDDIDAPGWGDHRIQAPGRNR